MIQYLIIAVAVVIAVLVGLMLFYKNKAKRLKQALELADHNIIQLKAELSHVHISQQVEANNAVLDSDTIDQRLHDQGYFRD